MRQQIQLNARGSGILDGRQVRAMAFAPARKQLLDRLARDGESVRTGQRRALLVGGGYSPLSAALRNRGFDTTAIDPSEAATALARVDTSGVHFRTADPSGITVEPASFDLVYCADTLEVFDSMGRILTVLAAAAKPGATVILDTVTDTRIAKLIYLVAFQRFPFTRIMPSGRYRAAWLRNPHDVEEACSRAGLRVERITGFEPKSVRALVGAILDRKSGRIADEGLPSAAGFRLSGDGHAPVVTYFAVATKLANA